MLQYISKTNQPANLRLSRVAWMAWDEMRVTNQNKKKVHYWRNNVLVGMEESRQMKNICWEADKLLSQPGARCCQKLLLPLERSVLLLERNGFRKGLELVLYSGISDKAPCAWYKCIWKCFTSSVAIIVIIFFFPFVINLPNLNKYSMTILSLHLGN